MADVFRNDTDYLIAELSQSGKNLVHDILETKEDEEAEANEMHITTEKLPVITADSDILGSIQELVDELANIKTEDISTPEKVEVADDSEEDDDDNDQDIED